MSEVVLYDPTLSLHAFSPTANANFAMQGVFNKHAEQSRAFETAAEIDSDSIVFLKVIVLTQISLFLNIVLLAK